MKESHLTELQQLTDSIVRGERVVLFAPGLWSVILVVFLLLGSTVILLGSLISVCCAELEAPSKAAYQLMGFVALFLFVILPSLLIFRGIKAGRSIMLAYSAVLVGVSICSVLLLKAESHLIPFFLSLVTATVSFFLLKTPSYILCSEFYYLLKTKRKEKS